jgi:hypothetical protein
MIQILPYYHKDHFTSIDYENQTGEYDLSKFNDYS